MKLPSDIPDILTTKDIIVTGQQPWDVEIGSNCKNIALEFSRYNRVLYINPPLDRKTLWRNKKDPKIRKRLSMVNKQSLGLEKINSNLWVYYPDIVIESINWIGNNKLFEIFHRINSLRFARSIRKALIQLHFTKIILFNDNDIFRSFYLKELLKPEIYAYYSRDYLLSIDYWKRKGEKLEPELIAKSDVCVANSTYLADYCSRYNPNSFYVGQGCDLEIFTDNKNLKLPADLIKINKPIIGYVGALQSNRLDIKMIQYIADQKPEWSIVFVGPEDEQFKNSDLHKMKNIFFAGAKDFNLLPAYINAFDVCINPQLSNEITIGNYPRKIDEYLAMGKPVVATQTDAMNSFANYTYLGKTEQDYIVLIEKAIIENTIERQERRKSFAATHTWENSVKQIYKAINYTLQKRKASVN